MKAMLDIAREIIGLFVDDGFLAIAVICVVAITSAIAAALPAGREAARRVPGVRLCRGYGRQRAHGAAQLVEPVFEIIEFEEQTAIVRRMRNIRAILRGLYRPIWKGWLVAGALAVSPPAVAGLPFLSDDPAPTPYEHKRFTASPTARSRAAIRAAISGSTSTTAQRPTSAQANASGYLIGTGIFFSVLAVLVVIQIAAKQFHLAVNEHPQFGEAVKATC